MYACRECGTEDVYVLDYMVHNHLWDIIANHPREIYCIDCVYLRLRRILRIADLKLYPINHRFFIAGKIYEDNGEVIHGRIMTIRDVGIMEYYERLRDADRKYHHSVY